MLLSRILTAYLKEYIGINPDTSFWSPLAQCGDENKLPPTPMTAVACSIQGLAHLPEDWAYRALMGLGNCADPLTELFQEKHPGYPFVGGLMKDAWLLMNVDVQIPEPGHRDNHQRHILPLPCTHTPQHLSSSWCLTMAPLRTLQPSDHCVFQGCSNLTAQNDCTSALANSCFLLCADFCLFPLHGHRYPPLEHWCPIALLTMMISDMYSPDFNLIIVYILINSKSASPTLISPLNF